MNSPDRIKRFEIHLTDERQTARLGAALARVLGPGDTVLLQGPLGAGKSALARAVIAALLGDAEAEIPSPSYTLVNIYETAAGPVWHADLYRLSGAAEDIEELGLADAIGTALLLVEWPDRMGSDLPERRLDIKLSAPQDGGRDVKFRTRGKGWERVADLLRAWT